MASLKLTVFLMVALAYASTVHCDDEILDTIQEKANQVKEKIEETQTESKGIFDSFKEKVSNISGKVVEKAKETYHATADAVSDGYNKLKDKAKEFVDKKPESPVTEKILDVPN